MSRSPATRPPDPPDALARGAGELRPLTYAVLAVVTLPLMLLVLALLLTWQETRREIHAELERLVEVMEEHAARTLEAQALVAAAVDSLLADHDDAAIRAGERALSARLRELRDLARVQDVLVIGHDGKALASAAVYPVPRGLDYAAAPWFRTLQDGAASILTEPGLRGAEQASAFLHAWRRRQVAGFAGAVAIAVSPNQYRDAYRGFGADVPLFEGMLLREDGLVLARHPYGAGGTAPAAGVLSAAQGRGAMGGLLQGVAGGDRQPSVMAWRRVPGTVVMVAAALPAGELTRRFTGAAIRWLVVGVPAWLGLAALAVVALRRARRAVAADAARRQTEAMLIRAQRLEALGQLTGGVAHDFNNLLQVILSGLAVLPRAQDPARRQAVLDAMRQAATRGGALTQQLLAFARRQALAPAPLDFAARIAGMREMLDRSLRGDIVLAVHLPRDLWPVQADATQLDTAVVNLSVNARDAMPRGGRLTISARNLYLGPGEDAEGLAGDYVRITVADTGMGMSPEVMARVFEPFFTTKERGRGTGLGLAQVYGFAQQSGGAVRIESREGEGTQVHLLLPRAQGTPQLEPADARPVVPEPEGRRCLEVLVVEDDAEVGALTAELLRQLGHHVTRVGSVAAALGALADGRRVDLLFTDVVMPGPMDGLALAEEARRRRPTLPVLLVSGFAGAPARVARAGLPLLRKPYGLEALERALDEAMTVAV